MEIARALKLLEEYMGELEHLQTLYHKNEERWLWHNKVNVVLTDAFGKNSEEYENLNPKVYVNWLKSDEEQQEEYLSDLKYCERGIKKILQKYEILGIETKTPATAEPKDTTELPVYLFDKMQFHPKVIEASKELFEDGHYRDAIYRAFVEVNNFVKDKANSQLDGRKLMSTVFSLDNPVIKLNPLKTQSDKDEQEGFMFLFMGAMEGIRNPKAHENIIQNDPYKALEYLSFASLLMQTIDFWEAEET